MSVPAAPPASGAVCVLVDATVAERTALEGLPDVVSCTATELDRVVTSSPGVDVLVVGSQAVSPVAVVQRAHRLASDAGVVVVPPADSADEVRRSIAYAPGVPLGVQVVEGPAALAEEVARLRNDVAQQRRHRGLLAAVTSRGESAPASRPHLTIEIGALLEHAPLGVLVCDPAGGLVGWNRRADALLGLPATPTDMTLDELLPGARALVTAAVDPLTGQTGAPPLVLVAADGVELEVSAVTSQFDDAQPVVLLLLLDVTQRRTAERARDRLEGHVALLSRVSESLTATLDTAEALDRLTAALVPDLADWVTIQLADGSGQPTLVVMRHRDAALAHVVGQARARQAVAASEQAPSRRAARSNAPLLLSDVGEAELARLVPDDELRALVAQLGVDSVVAVPLPGRGRVLGSLVLVNRAGSRTFSHADVTLALDIGRRAGVALDNARLYTQQRDLATELQRSLLTAPPQPDHGQIVVRYVAAAQEAQVGGDWYDAFVQPDGATVLVIGDVVGHDTRAAAGMSQLRGVLRGIGYTTGGDPAEVLSRVDDAIQGLLIETTATAVVARLEQDQPDLEQGRTWLTWSNAGHPPPLLVDPVGRVSVLGGGADGFDADLLLGIDPTTTRSTTRTAVEEGSTLLLYTDGLVERRGQSLDEGLDALVEVLRDCSGLTLDELCDRALHRLLPAAPEDDVALVAVRLHSQRRPRPPEAGPNRVPPGVPPAPPTQPG